MSGRPEAGDGYGLPDEYESFGNRDRDAWHGFTPYRPGDRIDEAPIVDSVSTTELEAGGSMAKRLEAGDRVRSTRTVGGVLGGAVPAGTEGRVISIEHGIFSEHVTVQFANGYTEKVKPSDVEYQSGWY